jgi:hypothetical protein
MERYTINLIGIPKSLKTELDKKGNWQRLTDLCRKSGAEIWVFDGRPFSPGKKLPRTKTASTNLTPAESTAVRPSN